MNIKMTSKGKGRKDYEGVSQSGRMGDAKKQLLKSGWKKKSIEEGLYEKSYTPKMVKQAIGIASDDRYAGGNMTGATRAIEKLAKGLSNYPQVKAVLKRQNEELDESVYDKKLTQAWKKLLSVPNVRGISNSGQNHAKKLSSLLKGSPDNLTFEKLELALGTYETHAYKAAEDKKNPHGKEDLAKLEEFSNSVDDVIGAMKNLHQSQLPEGFMDTFLGRNMKKGNVDKKRVKKSKNAEQVKLSTEIDRKLRLIDDLMQKVRPLGGNLGRLMSFRKLPIDKMTPKGMYVALNDWWDSVEADLDDDSEDDNEKYAQSAEKLYDLWEEVGFKLSDYMWASGYNVKGIGQMEKIGFPAKKRTDAEWLKMSESVDEGFMDTMKQLVPGARNPQKPQEGKKTAMQMQFPYARLSVHRMIVALRKARGTAMKGKAQGKDRRENERSLGYILAHVEDIARTRHAEQPNSGRQIHDTKNIDDATQQYFMDKIRQNDWTKTDQEILNAMVGNGTDDNTKGGAYHARTLAHDIALSVKYAKKDAGIKESVELDEAKSQGMFVVLEKGSKNKVIGQFKDKSKAVDMMKKNAGSKVIRIGKFATDDDKPVDIKVGDELSYTRVKLATKVKESVDFDLISEASLIPQLQKIVDEKSASKIKGTLVDMFTASMITQIYSKVNDANKEKMDKLPLEKLVNLAHKIMKKEAREMTIPKNEAKSDYTIMHKSYSDAMSHAYDVAKKRGYEVDMDDVMDKVSMGPRKPSEGKTNSHNLTVTKGGKPVKKQLNVQVYNRGGSVPYELNMYIEELETENEPMTLDEMREPYAVVDTAAGNKVVGTASDEKGAKSIIVTSERPPMKIKDKKTLKIMKSKKRQMIGQPFKESVEHEQNLTAEERAFVESLNQEGYGKINAARGNSGPVTVDKEKYSWGKMITVHHGNSVSYPLHPKHQLKIKNLKDGELINFTDETGEKVAAKRVGDKVHLRQSGVNAKTTVDYKHFNESYGKKMKTEGGYGKKKMKAEGGYGKINATYGKKTKEEELSAKQKKIDLNKNGKIDGSDLTKLRAKNEETLNELGNKYVMDTRDLAKVQKALNAMGATAPKVVKDKAGYFHIKFQSKVGNTGRSTSSAHQGPYHTMAAVLDGLMKMQKESTEISPLDNFLRPSMYQKEIQIDEKKKDYKDHMMYDPKTGKGRMTTSYEDHLDLKDKGWGHEKPTKESLELEINEGLKMISRQVHPKGGHIVTLQDKNGKKVVRHLKKGKVTDMKVDEAKLGRKTPSKRARGRKALPDNVNAVTANTLRTPFQPGMSSKEKVRYRAFVQADKDAQPKSKVSLTKAPWDESVDETYGKMNAKKMTWKDWEKQGNDAWMSREKRKDNPYKKKGQARTSWFDGWDNMQKDSDAGDFDESVNEKAPKVDMKKYAAHMDRNKKKKTMSSTKKNLSDISKRAEKMANENMDEMVGALSMEKAAAELEAYAKKYGGMDKNTFMRVANLLKTGNNMKLQSYVNNMDTDPRDYVAMLLKKHIGKKPTERMLGIRFFGESISAEDAETLRAAGVKLVEISGDMKKRYNKAALKDRDQQKNTLKRADDVGSKVVDGAVTDKASPSQTNSRFAKLDKIKRKAERKLANRRKGLATPGKGSTTKVKDYFGMAEDINRLIESSDKQDAKEMSEIVREMNPKYTDAQIAKEVEAMAMEKYNNKPRAKKIAALVNK